MRADAVRNRGRILRVTIDLVLEHGPVVPMEVIARRAEVGVATVYRHFPDRASLFTQVQLDVLGRAAEAAESALREEKDAFAGLARYLHAAIDLPGSAVMPMLNEHVLPDESLVAARRRERAAVESLVSRAHRERALRPEVSTGDIAILIIRLSRPIPGVSAADNLELSHRHLELLLDGFLHFLGAGPLPGPPGRRDDVRVRAGRIGHRNALHSLCSTERTAHTRPRVPRRAGEMMRVAASQSEPTSRTVRLLLVDDHALVVMAMTAAFEDVPDIELVGSATSAAEAVAEAVRLRPDVVLLDRRLPDGDGVDVIGRILDAASDVRVLLFTGAADQAIADRVADAGGAGILLKAGVLEDMLATIRSVAAGNSSFDVRPSGRPRVR